MRDSIQSNGRTLSNANRITIEACSGTDERHGLKPERLIRKFERARSVRLRSQLEMLAHRIAGVIGDDDAHGGRDRPSREWSKERHISSAR